MTALYCVVTAVVTILLYSAALSLWQRRTPTRVIARGMAHVTIGGNSRRARFDVIGHDGDLIQVRWRDWVGPAPLVAPSAFFSQWLPADAKIDWTTDPPHWLQETIPVQPSVPAHETGRPS